MLPNNSKVSEAERGFFTIMAIVFAMLGGITIGALYFGESTRSAVCGAIVSFLGIAATAYGLGRASHQD